MKSPSSYNPNEIRGEMLTPRQVADCIEYVLNFKLESVRRFNPTFEIGNITKTLVVAYVYVIDNNICPGGTLSLETTLPNGERTFYALALFRNSADAQETFRKFVDSECYTCMDERTESSLIIKSRVTLK